MNACCKGYVVNNLMYSNGSLNDKVTQFLIDTGAAVNVVSHVTVNELGIPLKYWVRKLTGFNVISCKTVELQ